MDRHLLAQNEGPRLLAGSCPRRLLARQPRIHAYGLLPADRAFQPKHYDRLPGRTDRDHRRRLMSRRKHRWAIFLAFEFMAALTSCPSIAEQAQPTASPGTTQTAASSTPGVRFKECRECPLMVVVPRGE